MGLTTYFFNPAPSEPGTPTKKGYGNRLQNGEMVVSRIIECMSENDHRIID
jgi:hypothetical protein